MLFTNQETLDEKIVELLLKKERTAKSLLFELSNHHQHVTIQGVYKSLRFLITEEVVLKRKFTYSLSEDWRQKAVRIIEQSEPLELEDKERLDFDLSSLIHLDQQWKNVVLPLSRKYTDQPVFMYNPHYIWTHLSKNREVSEREYFESFVTKKTELFCLIGNATFCDKEMRKNLSNEYVHVEMGSTPFSGTDYPTIFGDYIVTTKISSQLADEIDDIYTSSKTISELEGQLSMLGIEKKRIRLVVERDREKAQKLRKRIAKDFAVPQDLVQKFNLY